LDERALLHQLRSQMVSLKKFEPFRIYRDEEIENLLIAKPKTLEELAKVPGFPAGGARVTKYGNAIVAIFNKPSTISEFKVHVDAEGDPVAEVVVKNMSFFSKVK